MPDKGKQDFLISIDVFFWGGEELASKGSAEVCARLCPRQARSHGQTYHSSPQLYIILFLLHERGTEIGGEP